jgi:hypothetical protein
VFELGQDVMVQAPMSRIIEIVLLAHYDFTPDRASTLSNFLLELFQEGGWVHHTIEQSAGLLEVVRDNDQLNIHVRDTVQVLGQLSNPYPVVETTENRYMVLNMANWLYAKLSPGDDNE